MRRARPRRAGPRAPFFLPVGVSRPHIPMVVPQARFDLCSIEQIAAAGRSDAIAAALPDAMDAGGHRDDTAVRLFPDHGFHQGNHDHKGKVTLWEEAADAPLIVVDPDQDGAGRPVPTPVAPNRNFATLTALAGIPTPATVTARSFAGLVDAGQGPYREGPVITFIDGSLSMRNGDRRLIRHEDGASGPCGLAADPRQRVNLAPDPVNAELVRAQVAILRAAGKAEGIRFSDRLAVLNGGNGDDRLTGRRGDDTPRAEPGRTHSLSPPATAPTSSGGPRPRTRGA